MNQQKLVKRFRDRVKSYLKSLCSHSPTPQIESAMHVLPIERRPIPRRKRHNFALNGGLLKISRKNVVLEEFETHGSMLRLPPALERHLGSRIAKETLAIFQGNFTDEVTKKIPFSIKITQKQPSLRPQGNMVLSRGNLPIRVNEPCIDVLVRELKTNQKQAIQHVFKSGRRVARSHIFVCHEELTLEDLRDVFDIVLGRQMMEVQRVMLLDKCIATVLYISPCNQFLQIDSESLIEFLLAQLAKISPYAEKIQIEPILTSLLNRGYFAEVANTFSNMIESNRVEKGFQWDFLEQIQEKHPYTTDAVKKCDIPQRTEPQTSIQSGTIADKTPLFGVRIINSTFQPEESGESSPKRVRRSTNFQSLFQGMGPV